LKELSPELWYHAWLHWEGRKLKQCGDGVHPAEEMCANCFPKPKSERVTE